MLTPFDIEKKEFSKGVRGYSIEEVDEFLDQVIVDLEKIIKENLRLKAEIAALEQENEKYKGSEGEVIKVLQKAQDLMGDISKSAEKRAEVLLKNAQMDADLTVREARDRAAQLMEQNKILEARYTKFRSSYKRYLDSELAKFEEEKGLIVPFDDSKAEELVNEPISVPKSYAKPQEEVIDEFTDLEKALFGEDTIMGSDDINATGDDALSRKTTIVEPLKPYGED